MKSGSLLPGNADLRVRSPPKTPQMRASQQPELQPPTQDRGPGRASGVQKSAGRPGLTYEPVQKLGEGAFGVAHLVRDKRSGVARVLKTINKRLSQVPPKQLEHEIKNLKACDHPHIIRLYEYYEDYENVYLIMERAAGGELHQVIQAQAGRRMYLPERWVTTVTRQCLQAICYVHCMGIIHKDLKSENILLMHENDINDPHQQPHAVIIDLGIAELFAARLGRRARCTVVAGTPTHMAPEVWRGNFGPVADVWSLGVVLFELLSGEIPFHCNSSSLNCALEWIRLHKLGPNWSLVAHATNQARALCQRMLSCDERMRPTAQQCLGHSWFKESCAGESAEMAAGDVEDSASPVAEGGSVAAQAPAAATHEEEAGGRLGGELHGYEGRSRFEKAVMLQVASQLHTSQIGRIGELFERADRDRSGTIQRGELLAVLAELGAEQGDAEAYTACLDADVNGHVDANGYVEYTEFVSGCIGLLYESLRGLLWQSFCVIDENGNGVLCRDEVRAVVTRPELGQHGFPSDGSVEVDEALSRMDVDGNGQISFDELCRHFLPARPALPQRASPASGELAGAADQGWPLSAAPAVRALRDDEFALLLDEIENDTSKDLANRSRSLESMPEAAIFEQMSIEQRQSIAPGIAEFGGASAAAIFGTGAASPVGELAPMGQSPEPAATGGDKMSVDEELSTLLADIANGPY
mmetsp:Transcript_98104/g.218821  ORF Transcript_98104/g.218821 Transcript_98104/m.218821 type:complete len:698 (-) Transcript_98104:80-2173(-)